MTYGPRNLYAKNIKLIHEPEIDLKPDPILPAQQEIHSQTNEVGQQDNDCAQTHYMGYVLGLKDKLTLKFSLFRPSQEVLTRESWNVT